MPHFSRRDLLKITTQGLLGLSGLLGIGGMIRFLSFQPDPPPPQRFEVGPGIKYPLGSRTVLKDIPAVIIRDSNGLIALSLTCPHLGCMVESKSDEFICPCHGSRYDKGGQLLQGPAQKGLKALRVEITTNDQIIIYKS